jgi:hypothetical protein
MDRHDLRGTPVSNLQVDVTQLAFINLVLLFFLKVTLFLLGYLVVRLGYRLLDAGVKGEFKFQAAWSGLRADLASASPGLLFLLLGVVLMGYAMGVSKIVELDIQGPADLAPPAPVFPDPARPRPEVPHEP